MTMTVDTMLTNPPVLDRTAGFSVPAGVLAHPELAKATADVVAKFKAYSDAAERYAALRAPAAVNEAIRADTLLVDAAVAAGGTYVDPGTPNLDKLATDRAETYREASARLDVYREARHRWIRDVRRNHATYTASYAQQRDAAASEIRDAMTRIAELAKQVDTADLAIAWLADPERPEQNAAAGPDGYRLLRPLPNLEIHQGPVTARAGALLAQLGTSGETA